MRRRLSGILEAAVKQNTNTRHHQTDKHFAHIMLALTLSGEKLMFVVLISYTAELSEIDPFVEEHIAFLDKYYEAGNFITSGRKVPRTGGVIFAHANSVDEINAILSEDPFHRENLALYEVTEFAPNKFAKGYEGLEKYG